VQENATLRDKLASLKSDFVAAESAQQSSRDKMIDKLINEQSNMARLTDNLHTIIQVPLHSVLKLLFLQDLSSS